MDGYIPFAQAGAEQAAALEATIPLIRARLFDSDRASRFRGPGPVLIGIGASLAAACAPIWVLRSRGIDAWRLDAGDHPLPFPASSHPVVGISQSGRSSETLAVLESVQRECRFAVTNVQPSPISDVASVTLWLGNLRDSYASTIGYTATLLALGMLAETWDGGQPDAGWGSLPVAFRALDESLDARAPLLATRFDSVPFVDFVGAGPSLGSAEMGALLFREVARVPSAALGSRQYLHGAMESAGRGVHVVLGGARESSMAQLLADAGHRVLMITTDDVAERPWLDVLRVPRRPPAQLAILEAVVLQRLASAVAARAGVDVDAFVFHSPDTKVADGELSSAR